ncbi:MAG: hypothetical protein AAGH78_14800 [Cyanobacteria bacterium P01_H01_bin.58]
MPASQPLPKIATAGRSRPAQRRSPKLRQRSPHQAQLRGLGYEMLGRLGVNLILSLVALSALARLLPYHWSQRQALHEAETLVTAAESHTQQLQAEFSRYFDPAQANRMMRENGVRESADHIPIVWVDPTVTQSADASSEETSEADAAE